MTPRSLTNVPTDTECFPSLFPIQNTMPDHTRWPAAVFSFPLPFSMIIVYFRISQMMIFVWWHRFDDGFNRFNKHSTALIKFASLRCAAELILAAPRMTVVQLRCSAQSTRGMHTVQHSNRTFIWILFSNSENRILLFLWLLLPLSFHIVSFRSAHELSFASSKSSRRDECPQQVDANEYNECSKL